MKFQMYVEMVNTKILEVLSPQVSVSFEFVWGGFMTTACLSVRLAQLRAWVIHSFAPCSSMTSAGGLAQV